MKNFLKGIVVIILGLEARAALARHRPRVIAVTGSVGKTGTKDAVYAVLSETYGKGKVRRGEKSLNSDIGLPLAVLGLENAWSSFFGWIKNIWLGARTAFFENSFPQWLVLEVGADHPGDIEKISKWLCPDIVVLTRMSDVPVHIEYFKDAEEILREKMFLARALKPGGTVVVNADDQYFMKAVRNLSVRKILYGSTKEADVKILETKAALNGQYGTIEVKNKKQNVELGAVIGNHIMYSVAAAFAVAETLNISLNLADIFRRMDMPRGRMRLLKGKSGSVIIDDTYNSSPIACVEALKTLGDLPAKGRKIAVLGDMKELGIHAEEAHRKIGKLAGETVQILVTAGKMARDIAAEAQKAGLPADHITSFASSNEAKQNIADTLREGDVVLVKGSQSMRMEKIVEAILENPAQAPQLLVRQEEEWKNR